MKTIIYIFLLLALVHPLISQPQKDVITIKSRYGFEVERRPIVNFNIVPHYSGDNWIPDLFLAAEIQNDRLQFIKEADVYRAQYQISVIIRREKETIFKQNWDEVEELNNFAATNSKETYQYKVYRLNIPLQDRKNLLQPGDYECFFQVLDLISEKKYNNSRKFKLTAGKPDNIRTGPLTFIKAENDSGHILPFIPSDGALIYSRPYTAYANVFMDTIRDIRINARIYKMGKEEGNLFYQKYFTLLRDSAITDLYFKLPVDTMAAGKYLLSFSGYAGEMALSMEKEFEIYWYNKPTYLYKADLAIRPMRYLLSEEEFSRVEDLGYDQKEAWMESFWAERDPTPGTEYNELKVEFFNRVKMANDKFALRFKEGWETDRGRILLLYGEPDKVENRRYAAGQKPHLVWTYNKNNLTFLFVDDDRDGEFTLVTEQ